MLRCLPLLCLLLPLGACAPSLWTPRTIPACYASTGVAELDRERSYYAVLLALQERSYVILHAETGLQIEAEYESRYKPEQSNTHWLIDIAADGALHVQTVPPEAPMHKKQEQWFQLLSQSARRLQCRELNWLRWEAQNRGLIPMTGGVAPPAGASGPGGEQPLVSGMASATASPGAAAALANGHPLSVAEQRRLSALRSEREQISLRTPIGLTATGAALGLAAISVGSSGIIYYTAGCDSAGSSSFGGATFVDCSTRDMGRNMLIAAGALGAGVFGFLIPGLTLLLRRQRRVREIGREIKGLTGPISLWGDRRSVNLSLRLAF